MKFPVAGMEGADPKFRTPPVMVPMAVSWIESKSSKSTAPGTELVAAPGLMVTEMAIAGLTASTHPAAASATLSFDFMVPALSTNHRSRHQHRSYNVPLIE